jgi:flagellar biosynthetic protein FliR
MITFTLADWYSWISQILWPLFRIAAFILVCPILGESTIPPYIRLSLAALISLGVAPILPPVPTVAPDSFYAMGIILEQLMIGMALGLTIRMTFAAVRMAGELIGLQMGLSFASFFDPGGGGSTSVMSRILNTFATLFFIAINGHLILIMGLAKTFEILPIGGQGLMHMNGIGQLIVFSEQIFLSGMLIALPMFFVLLTINLAMGILNRTAQQLSVFAVGFPITLSVGIGLLVIVLPAMSTVLDGLFYRGMTAMSQVAIGLSPSP